MKKSLLLAFSVFCAISMNAHDVQRIKKADLNLSNAKVQASFVNKPSVSASVLANANIPSASEIKSLRMNRKAAPARIASQNELLGEYFEDYIDTEFDLMYSFPVGIGNVEIEGDQYLEFNGGFGGYFCESAIGGYDGEKVVVFGGQVVSEMSGYQLVLMPVTILDPSTGSWDFATDEEGYITDLTYTVNEEEEGTYLTLDQDGYVILVFGDINDWDSLEGYAELCLEGETLNMVNAGSTYEYNHIANGGWAGWESAEKVLFIENYGDVALVHGFYDQFCFEVALDPDNYACSIQNQTIYAENYQGQDNIFGIYEITTEGVTTTYDHISTAYYDPSRNYFALGNPISETEMDWNQYAFCTPYVEGVGAYFIGQFYGIQMAPLGLLFDYVNPYRDNVGINTVLAPTAKAGVFNLAGQRVNNANGLVIEGGKKVIR